MADKGIRRPLRPRGSGTCDKTASKHPARADDMNAPPCQKNGSPQTPSILHHKIKPDLAMALAGCENKLHSRIPPDTIGDAGTHSSNTNRAGILQMATGQSIGPFELGEKLGAGGMGVVYRARYNKTGQMVALKLLAPALLDDEKLVARFQRELDVLKKLKHPNIIQFFGGGRLGKQQFYVMELIEGGSLADVLKQKVRRSWEDTIQYGMQE